MWDRHTSWARQTRCNHLDSPQSLQEASDIPAIHTARPHSHWRAADADPPKVPHGRAFVTAVISAWIAEWVVCSRDTTHLGLPPPCATSLMPSGFDAVPDAIGMARGCLVRRLSDERVMGRLGVELVDVEIDELRFFATLGIRTPKSAAAPVLSVAMI